ncbi:sperm acrosome associated 7 [Phyllostomus discolor]|uniref:Sperm acrosome associated 7 n=1 Tax=Phyllostomus discolor TaxID=89673 RepID=A0A833YXZ4_9CHIR|nr:sperm acrosome associated 7 [Phyllostomus discolor]
MAANKGVTLFVLLLYCCHKAEQPINASSDEVLVQDVLNPNKSSRFGTYRTTAMLSTKTFKGKNAGTDENDQSGPKSYHELSDNSQFSLGSEDKTVNNGSSVKDSYQASSPEGYGESHFSSSRKDGIFNNETKNSKNDHSENLSILDKILENIRKYSGILSNKLKRTTEAQRTESSQRSGQRGISVKQEILTE